MRLIITALILVAAQAAGAQRIYGTVFNEAGDLLPFASITVKGTSKGASANIKANFSFSLSDGTYTLVCQSIGYTAQEKNIIIKGETEVTFILKRQDFKMAEVVVKTGEEDPAYEIIRQAVKKRSFYAGQVKAYKVDLYGKDLVKLRNLPTRILGKKIKEKDRAEMGVDSSGKGIIYLSESNSILYKQQPDKFKMEVISSRVSGSGGFGFTFPAVINLYSNNVQVFTERLNPRGFISPIADGAIGFYKFKFLGTFFEGGKAINSIKLIPRRKYEPLFSGIINITDGDWRIHSYDLLLTKTAQLELLDSLQVQQLHVPVTTDVWMVKTQLLHFNFKQFKIDAIGNFLTVYNDYELKENFDKKFFDRIVIKYDTAVNKKTTAYWDSIRPVPLEPEELKDYAVKDSIYKLQRDSASSQRQLDSLKKKQGKLQLTDIFWSGIHRTHYSKTNPYTYHVEPMLSSLEYNTAEGIVLQLHASMQKQDRKKKNNISIEPHLRYGVNNRHFNSWVGVYRTQRRGDENANGQKWNLAMEAGKRVSEFNKESSINPLINSLGILLYGKNNMKTYENWFGNVVISKKWYSGIHLLMGTTWEDRLPLYNTTWFTFSKKDSIHITPNYPVEKMNSQFTPHQALSFSAAVRFRPGQRYIQFPTYRMAISSKYPLFTLQYSKGLHGILGSDVDYDKWRFTISDDKNLKLAGLVKYRISAGGFLNNKQVYIQDYQHFNGNRSIAASAYVNSFQLASFYANSTTAPIYGTAHVEYHLNGLLTNKIPLFRQLGWNLVTGSNAFYVNTSNNHMEVFAGLENILKIFRVDFVAAYENGAKGVTGIRIGSGGNLGANFTSGRRSASGEFRF